MFIRRLKKFLYSYPNPELEQPQQARQAPSPEGKPLSEDLSDSLELLQKSMGKNTDFVIHYLAFDEESDYKVILCYIDGLVDQLLLSKLLENLNRLKLDNLLRADKAPADWLKNQLAIGNIRTIYTEEDLEHAILDGRAVVLVQGMREAFAVYIAGGSRRAVEEPSSQTVIRGPKEGFTEEITVNIALLRRKVKSPQLTIETHVIGTYTRTNVSIAYIEGIASPEVVKEMTTRIQSIEIDGILESGYIEELIQDGVMSPFPTMYNTERPDTVAGGLLEGLVAVFVDGTPFVLMAPVTFFRFLTSSEDYYQRFDISSFLRFVRIISFFVALLLPSIFISLTTFHQELLPMPLLISLAAQREITPLPTLVEALLMELTFEVIREAGVRMPRAIGPAISIVGALVLGQAAVQAGLVSAAVVIVVSFTAISNFALPAINFSSSIRLLRFALMVFSGSFGLVGVLGVLIPLMAHLVSLESFGVPYLIPMSPFNKTNQKDVLIRAPWWKMRTRPIMIGDQNQMRQTKDKKSYAELEAGRPRDPLA
ncbi:spore germination protein KA [Paenibacillus rhizosphaerae]|uniref:Spore germination protein KA n=1 Tax=Paenibacillus rhizosphaerae TaxID=297318 RepID=A0A839TJW9_9BACL|nr:spore germination protein [Paenibacillus rhizosphaerae]MBB3125688.1 spore germination protein KA [Paenibacillus rhizosphaerae]